ncbi:MAG: tyrosine-type recombinase/integrase [Clostridia bacterium]|nr:tyrosine-type recombinase/integrase [Clostridia bacterium]
MLLQLHPDYKSVFAADIVNLIETKQSLGFKYHREQLMLKRIDTFLIDHHLTERTLTKTLVEEWCKKRSYETIANQNNRITVMRVFARHLTNCGVHAYVPPLYMTRHGPKYEAHIYTRDELHRFFAVVDKSQSAPSAPYRNLIMPVFFRILYTSGMRVSELRLARICDVHIEDAYITVHGSKNHKDRNVPIRRDLAECCRVIKERIHNDSPDDEFFFMQYPGRAHTLQNLYHNFRRYLEKANIPHTGKGPRIHDFRHTFCVNLLKKWIDEGKELLSYVEYMRTMLGHETFNETAYYLKLTMELYPAIRDKMKASFPNMIAEVNLDDIE